MSKMIMYLFLFIPLLILSTDSSSIKNRNHKNDLVPFLSSRLEPLKKDNNMKIDSKEPFIIHLQVPNSKETEAKVAKEKDKKRKRPAKKRVSKIKPLRKKHRKRRDLLTSKTKAAEEKQSRFGTPHAENKRETQLKNFTRHSVNRTEILKALALHPKKTETKPEGFKNEDKTDIGIRKKINESTRNLHKHHLLLSDRTKMVYPKTPKFDRQLQKYTYKDLAEDRERLEHKIKYIKKILNDSTTDDAVRVRRKSDSDRTANKIAKMFLTLSAVNGLHDRKKSKCNNEDDDEDRVQDVWEKEKRSSPFRKSTSSNEERYKVKKWIEFMKNKRLLGKTCPCMANDYDEESDAFPLERQLPKGYFLMEKEKSSEESSELYRDPFYNFRDKPNRNDNVKKHISKSQDQESKIKALSQNGKKNLQLPFEDLELYRSRARQILQNAEEILDKIKEEEEKRRAVPNILMSQLKELTSRIQGDPRNNENDLIRKIQKTLSRSSLDRSQENTDGTFLDNVKSFILDPYEKARALTDESTKKLSTYLLRNLGKLHDSSENKEIENVNDKTDDDNLKIFFGEVPQREEKLLSASLAREEPRADGLSEYIEDLQNEKDPLSAALNSGDDSANKDINSNISQKPFQQKMEDLIKANRKELNDYKGNSGKDIENIHSKEVVRTLKTGKEIAVDSKLESVLDEEKVATKLKEKNINENNRETIKSQSTWQSDDEKELKSTENPEMSVGQTSRGTELGKNKKFREMESAFQRKESQNDVAASRNMQEEEEFEEEIKEILETVTEKEKSANKSLRADDEVGQPSNAEESERKPGNKDVATEVLKKQYENTQLSLAEDDTDNGITLSPGVKDIISVDKSLDDSTVDQRDRDKNYVSSQFIFLTDKSSSDDDYVFFTPTVKNSKDIVNMDPEDGESESNEEPVLENQEQFDRKQTVEVLAVEKNKYTSENFEEDADLETEEESPDKNTTNFVSMDLQRESKVQDLLHDEITQKESGPKRIPEYVDLLQDNKEFKTFPEANLNESNLEGNNQSFETLEDKIRKEEKEILKSEDEENQNGKDIRMENANGNTLETMLNNESVGFSLEERTIENNSTETTVNQEYSTDVNLPLITTLENQDDSPELLKTNLHKESNIDSLLKEINSEEKKNKILEDLNDITDVKEIIGAENQKTFSKERNQETLLTAERLSEDKSNLPKAKSLENDSTEVLLKESNLSEIAQNINKNSEALLKTVMNNEENENSNADETEYNSNETNEKDGNSNKESKGRTNLKASLDKDENLENDIDEITLKVNNPSYTDTKDKIQNFNENQKSSSDPVDDEEKQKQNQENYDYTEKNNVLEIPLDSLGKENLEVDEEATSSKKNQKENKHEKNDTEISLGMENPDDDFDTENKEKSQNISVKFPSSEEQRNPKEKSSEETSQKTNLNESVQDEKTANSEEKSSYENLQAILENQNQESFQAVEEEIPANQLHSVSPGNGENLKAVLENETQKNLKETSDEDSMKTVSLHDESQSQEVTLENQNNDGEWKDDKTLKEVNTEELEEDKSDNDDIGKAAERKTDESEENVDEDDKSVIKGKKFDDDFESQNNQNSNDESLRAENPDKTDEAKEDDKKTPLRSSGIAEEFDNKIEDEETALNSAQLIEESISANEDEREKIVQAENVPDDLNNQLNQENEGEAYLKLKHVEADSTESLNENSYETLGAENEKGKEESSPSTNPVDTNRQENLQSGSNFENLLQPQSLTKSAIASKLKVPESIGKIMKDLEGKEKYDITSIQNLNPDKIDDMLNKIGEAEARNLLESEEVDCRKECPCAEEMNMRSRNKGRYEIMKDFLHWMKDLQLNRVLSDD